MAMPDDYAIMPELCTASGTKAADENCSKKDLKNERTIAGEVIEKSNIPTEQ